MYIIRLGRQIIARYLHMHVSLDTIVGYVYDLNLFIHACVEPRTRSSMKEEINELSI